MLQSPHFLYRVETAGDAVAASPDIYQVTAYELATRLSYLAWGSTPDAPLLDSASSGALDTPMASVGKSIASFPTPRHAQPRHSSSGSGFETEDLPAVNQSPDFWQAYRAWASDPPCRRAVANGALSHIRRTGNVQGPLHLDIVVRVVARARSALRHPAQRSGRTVEPRSTQACAAASSPGLPSS